MISIKKAYLILENGMEFQGKAFGAFCPAAGEVVFNTAMTGYPESLTDPSFKGQLLVSTYPLIGNYGVPPVSRKFNLADCLESDRIQVNGLVIRDYSFYFSHWNAQLSLDDWLKEYKIPGIYGIDTRALTRIIREQGAMKGKIVYESPDEVDFYDPNRDNLVEKVSCKEKIRYGKGKYKIALIDCGVKNNIIRCLLKRNTTVIRVPWNYDVSTMDFDGIVISNGPGNPENCNSTIETTKRLLEQSAPVFGICLGHQIMSLAAGGMVYKLKYGHRGHNQPVRQSGTQRCFITSQNHGYAVDTETLPPNWHPLFSNLNDNSCEGIRHAYKPFFSTQFHPEASGGPTDTEYLFDDFMNRVAFQKGGK